MSINAFIQQGNTVMVAANATAPTGVQITCNANQSTNTFRIFNEDASNVAWYAFGDNAGNAQLNAKIAVAGSGSGNFGCPLPPLAVEVVRCRFTTPNVFISGITRVSVAANLHVTPGEGL